MTGRYLFWVGMVFCAIPLLIATVRFLSPDIMFEEAAVKLETRLSQILNPHAKAVNRLVNGARALAIGESSYSTRIEGQKEIPLLSAANPKYQYPYQLYDTHNRPTSLARGSFRLPESARRVHASTSEQIVKAIESAEPGDVISIAPGNYDFTGRSIHVSRAGEPGKPVYLRADRLGDATLSLNTMEGFHVKAPYWVFENLAIRGVCANDQECEHAFHVVGRGRAFVLRNSTVTDFNASIKVNGTRIDGNDFWPDDGLIEYNVFQNSAARATDRPVALLNIDSVDHWVARGNFIADFSKLRGNKVAYGAYMKGNGSFGVFERNVVVCEHNVAPDNGLRIGLSFGGGGTGIKYCRNQSCTSEHSQGVIRNNVIINCSKDVGIYLNRASDTKVYNNLLHNNLGIDVRFPTSSARISSNLISGRVKERDGGNAEIGKNFIDADCFGYKRTDCSFDELYADPNHANLQLISTGKFVFGQGILGEDVTDDLCGTPRPPIHDLGPLQYSGGVYCLRTQDEYSR